MRFVFACRCRGAILTLVGFVNVPIIKFSVDWWNTLHQPASVLRLDGPTIHASMLWPLLILALGFTLMALALHLVAMRAEIMRRRVRTLTILEAERLSIACEPYPGFPNCQRVRCGPIDEEAGGTFPRSTAEVGPVVLKRRNAGSGKETVVTSLAEPDGSPAQA